MTQKSLWFITITTFVYLIIELAFQSRLLDVAGTLVSIEEVEALEKFGRLISGTAVYLVFLGMIILPQATKKSVLKRMPTRIMFSVISAIIIISAVFFGEKALVDRMVDNSSGSDRKIAAQAVVVQNALLKDVITIDGMEISNENLKTPEGKAFAAVLPFLGSTILEGKLKKSIIRDILEQSAKVEIGDENEFLKSNVHVELKKLDQTYKNKYVPATNKYRKATAQNVIHNQSLKAWNQYIDELAKQKISPDSVPENKYPQVRSELRKKGIMVSNNWKPNDKAGFMKALESKYLSEASKNLRSEFDASWKEYIGALKEHHLTFGKIPNLVFPRVRKAVREKGLNVTDAWNPNDKIDFYKQFKETYKKKVHQKFKKESEKHWRTYLNSLANYEFNIKEIPKSHWPTIRSKLQKKGLHLPANWKPWDQKTFSNAYVKQYRIEALKRFKQEAKEILGFYPKTLKPGLLFKEFMTNKDVKCYMGSRGKYVGKSNAYILTDIIKTRTAAELKKLTGAPEDYVNGGKYEEFGKTAMRGVVVPPVALFFSLIGGIIHIFKTLNFALSFRLKPLLRLPLLGFLGAGLVLLIGTADLTNNITKTRVFKTLEAKTVEIYHPAVGVGIKTLIETAPISYPINNMLRETVLRGFQF